MKTRPTLSVKTSLKAGSPAGAGSKTTHEMNEIRFSFDKIEIEDKVGKT
jgi:hypothetical protein